MLPTHKGDREYEKFAEKDSKVAVNTIDLANLITEKYDYIELGYTGTNLTTVKFRDGGVGGTINATLTLSYTGDRLDSVEKS